jgi:hypothetical protein
MGIERIVKQTCDCKPYDFLTGLVSMDHSIAGTSVNITATSDAWVVVKGRQLEEGTLSILTVGNGKLVALINMESCLKALTEDSCNQIQFIEFCFMCPGYKPSTTSPTNMAPTENVQGMSTIPVESMDVSMDMMAEAVLMPAPQLWH